MAIATMRQLLEAGIHFGHQTRRWHPKMNRYIYGQRNGIYIIDLQHTLRQIYRAYALVRDTAAAGGNVLFVGTKKQAQEVIEREAQRCGQYYVTNRWLGGTLTNFKTVKESINELNRLEELETSGRINKYSKKEGIMMRKRREKLEKNLSGIKNMPGLPDIMFVIDAKREAIAVKEADRLHIPSIGVVDTNCDPDTVSLPVPGNDDAIRAIQLYCSVIADAVLEGRMQYEKTRGEDQGRRGGRGRQGADQEDGADKAAVAPDDTTRSAGSVVTTEDDTTNAESTAAAGNDEQRDSSRADADAAGDVPSANE